MRLIFSMEQTCFHGLSTQIYGLSTQIHGLSTQIHGWSEQLPFEQHAAAGLIHVIEQVVLGSALPINTEERHACGEHVG